VHIPVREDKENRADKSIELNKKHSEAARERNEAARERNEAARERNEAARERNEAARERNEKSRSPIRSTYAPNEKKSYTPIQFRKKTPNANEDDKSALRETSKSPFKKICNPPTLLKT
jgi:hypothetical protein